MDFITQSCEVIIWPPLTLCAVPRRSITVYCTELGWINCVLSSGLRHLLIAGPLYDLYWFVFCHRNAALIAVTGKHRHGNMTPLASQNMKLSWLYPLVLNDLKPPALCTLEKRVVLMTKINRIIVPAPAMYNKYCNKTSKTNDIIIMSVCIHVFSCLFSHSFVLPPFSQLTGT